MGRVIENWLALERIRVCTKSRTPESQVQSGTQHHEKAAQAGSQGQDRCGTVFLARIAGCTMLQSLRLAQSAIATIVFPRLRLSSTLRQCYKGGLLYFLS